MLQRIDQEALKQKSSRSEFVELFFEDAFFLRMLSLTQLDKVDRRSFFFQPSIRQNIFIYNAKGGNS